MNYETRNRIIKRANARRLDIADQKGAEYSREGDFYTAVDADTLANFRAVGKRLGITELQTWAIYFLKQSDAIATFVNRIHNGKLSDGDLQMQIQKYSDEGEGILSRLDDIRNYADILECLLYEYGVGDSINLD